MPSTVLGLCPVPHALTLKHKKLDFRPHLIWTLEVLREFYPNGVELPVTRLPASTKMTHQWVSSVLVSWAYQVYHQKGMPPASHAQLQKIMQDHPCISDRYDWSAWQLTVDPIMSALYGKLPHPVDELFDLEEVEQEAARISNSPTPKVESDPATMISELEKHQPALSVQSEVPMEMDLSAMPTNSTKHPHIKLCPLKAEDSNDNDQSQVHPSLRNLRDHLLRPVSPTLILHNQVDQDLWSPHNGPWMSYWNRSTMRFVLKFGELSDSRATGNSKINSLTSSNLNPPPDVPPPMLLHLARPIDTHICCQHVVGISIPTCTFNWVRCYHEQD
ncbi:hypothetical protein DFH29DRAFT_880044 [Suillus ampliporus]|nr:hypothetical protein DFH29DRAFT_880044 [Suillus ampliporus]